MSDPSSPEVLDYIEKLQEELSKIFKLTSEVTSSQSTRDYRQHSLITLCGQLKACMTQLVTAAREEGGEEEGGVWELAADMRANGTELNKMVKVVKVEVDYQYTHLPCCRA